jgi:hypothetical protein
MNVLMAIYIAQLIAEVQYISESGSCQSPRSTFVMGVSNRGKTSYGTAEQHPVQRFATDTTPGAQVIG